MNVRNIIITRQTSATEGRLGSTQLARSDVSPELSLVCQSRSSLQKVILLRDKFPELTGNPLSRCELSPSELSLAIQFHIFDCLVDISTWLDHHQLKLNTAKTKFLVFAPKHFYPCTLSISVNNLSFCALFSKPTVLSSSLAFHSPSLPTFNLSPNPASSFFTTLVGYAPSPQMAL